MNKFDRSFGQHMHNNGRYKHLYIGIFRMVSAIIQISGKGANII